MRAVLRSAAVLIALALPASAQDRGQSLADIRQELTVLFGQLRALGTELNTTGAPTGAGAQSGSALDRLSAIEGALQKLTARTEELEFRVNRIVQDGTRQIGDLEFRLCDLEEACNIADLGETPTLGGEAGAQTGTEMPTSAPPPLPLPDTGGPEFAIGEERDFQKAETALAAGNFQTAAEAFAAFTVAYPGSPLSPAALLGQGEALEALGDVREAARAYLSAFSADPTAGSAPDALFHLGGALGRLGKTEEACVTLGEVGLRYPGADAVLEAQSQMRNLGCS